jgi:hypothetical protein
MVFVLAGLLVPASARYQTWAVGRIQIIDVIP